MADDAHVVVEIPVDKEHQQKLKSAQTTMSAMENHPLAEISRSSGHLLLLKLWQREEHLFSRRISIKEARMESLRGEIFQLCCFFFIFHALFLTIMSATSIDVEPGLGGPMCGRWWVPAMISGCTSMVMVVLVQVKLGRYWVVRKGLMNERGDNRALNRCVQELRMKGASFDLSKEPQIGKKMKSSSVEIRWKPVSWCRECFLTICLVCFAGLLFPVSKFMLCF